jgi:hypothetical protein
VKNAPALRRVHSVRVPRGDSVCAGECSPVTRPLNDRSSFLASLHRPVHDMTREEHEAGKPQEVRGPHILAEAFLTAMRRMRNSQHTQGSANLPGESFGVEVRGAC